MSFSLSLLVLSGVLVDMYRSLHLFHLLGGLQPRGTLLPYNGGVRCMRLQWHLSSWDPTNEVA